MKSASEGAVNEGAAVVDREILFVLRRDGADFVDEAFPGVPGQVSDSALPLPTEKPRFKASPKVSTFQIDCWALCRI